jgi:hypothetical protein
VPVSAEKKPHLIITNGACIGSKAASGFREISFQVQNLHGALSSVHELISQSDNHERTTFPQRRRLAGLVGNCQSCLKKLEDLVEKYESLGTSRHRKRDVLRFASEDLPTLRSSIMVHTNAITLFLSVVGSGRLGRIESKLDSVVQEIESGGGDRFALTVANGSYPKALDFQWSLLKLELADDGFEAVDIESHRVWFERRLHRFIDDEQKRHVPALQERNEGWSIGRKISGQIYRYLGDKTAIVASAAGAVIRQGDYVVVPEFANWHPVDSGVALQCHTLDGLHIGFLECSKLAIVPGSTLVNGSVELNSETYELTLQSYSDLDTLQGRSHAADDHSHKLDGKRRSETPPIRKPTTPAGFVGSQPEGLTTRRNSTISRPVSRTGSVRSAISEYDADGRLVKTKTIVTSFEPDSPGYLTVRRNSAPTVVGTSKHSPLLRSPSVEERRDSQRPPISGPYYSPAPGPPISDYKAEIGPSRASRLFGHQGDHKPRDIETESKSARFRRHTLGFKGAEGDIKHDCNCVGDLHNTQKLLNARTRQVQSLLTVFSRLGLKSITGLARPLTNTQNNITAVDDELRIIDTQVTDLLNGQRTLTGVGNC